MKKRFYSSVLAMMLCMAGTAAWALDQVDGVYQIGTAQDLKDFAALADVAEADAKLTADIDMNGSGWISIEEYNGTFDGAGFAINNLGTPFIDYTSGGAVIKNLTLGGKAIDENKLNTAAFVNESEGAITFENCVNKTDVSNLANRAAGFLALSNKGEATFINCVNEAAITQGNSSTNGEMAGGLLGFNLGGKLTMTGCVNKGAITANHGAGGLIAQINVSGSENNKLTNCVNFGKVSSSIFNERVGSMVGFYWASGITYRNCWNIGEVDDSRSFAGSRGGGGSDDVQNCYDVNNPATGITQITMDQVESGELCYLLNKGANATVFYQTLGTDEYPVLDSTHGIVYIKGSYKCDGVTPKDGGQPEYTNSASDSSVDPHNFVDGICTVCNQYNPDFIVDGVFQISNATQLCWYSNHVNTVNNKAKAALTADIDMSSVDNFTPIGLFRDGNVEGTGLPQVNIQYHGTFDGQGHVIKNLTIKDEGYYETALFSRTPDDAIIKNLGIVNANISSVRSSRVAVLVGWMGVPTIENVYATGEFTITAGGGETTKTLIAESWNANGVKNCWTVCDAITGDHGNGTNNYAAVTEEDMESGKLCYDINQGAGKNIYYQTLGTDAYPNLDSTHSIVYIKGHYLCDGKTPASGGDPEFSNNASDSQVDNHTFVDDNTHPVCKVCGLINETYAIEKDEEEFYQIGSANDLVWFSAFVNQKNNTEAKGKLTADIDMTEVENFIPIGLFADDMSAGGVRIQYRGTFDGQGHVISNLTINDEKKHETGLFSRLGWGANAVVRKLGIVNANITSTHPYGRTGVICGITGSNCLIENCYVTGEVTIVTPEGTNEWGAITGGGSAGTIRNCWTDFERVSGGGNVVNCYPAATYEEMSSGELTWKLNEESFLDAVWYQTIDQDEHPVLDPTHGLVYMGDGQLSSAYDEASYLEFRDFITTQEFNYCDTVVAYQDSIDAYRAEVQAMTTIETRDEFVEAYRASLKAKAAVKVSEAAYLSYIAVCKSIVAELETNTTHNEDRDVLDAYLDEENAEEPGEHPNGNYGYIISTHTLSNEEIAAEIEYVKGLMNRVLLSDPEPGTDMTMLLQNPQFAEDWTGWTTDGNASMAVGGVREVMSVARGLEGNFEVKQTIEGIPNGIYEVRVNGMSARADNDVYSKLYYGEVFAEENINYLMLSSEEILLVDDAEDGVNCDLSGSAPDILYYDENTGEEGYIPVSLRGASYAFNSGRYLNRAAVTVTDGSITLGVRGRVFNLKENWVPFSNVRLIYLGQADDAADALTDVLDGYVARATVIRDFASDTGDFNHAPNIYSDIIDRLAVAIDESEAAETGEEKMELVDRFSDLFKEVYDCRMAYITLGAACDKLDVITTALFQEGAIDEAERDRLYELSADGWDVFMSGSLDAESALEKAEELFKLAGIPVQDENGTYQIGTAQELASFSFIVNSGENSANGVLTADIDMSSVANFTPIGLFADDRSAGGLNIQYRGTFDGQGHVISNLTINDTKLHETGLFSRLAWGAGAVVRNLGVVNANITSTHPYGRAGVICGITGYQCVIENCYVTGNVTVTVPEGQTEWGGITGGGSAGTIRNCWTSFERVSGGGTVVNCYAQPSAEWLESGELCFRLNAGAGETIFYQTLATDPYPVLSKTSLKVYRDKDGNFTNVDPDGINDIMAEETVAPAIDGIFDMSGRKVAAQASQLGNLPKGLYIVRGKKVLVK